MNRIAATRNWILAMASLAMMLAVQTLHPPMVHLLECGSGCCHSHSATDNAKAGEVAETGSHVHAHHGHVHVHHGHVHRHETKTDVAGMSDTSPSPGDSPIPGHQHSDECQLCQFLTQSAHLVVLPVLLTGEEAVSAPPVDILPEIVLVPLSGPYVRGPPMSV